MDSRIFETKEIEEKNKVKTDIEKSWETLERRRKTVMTGNVFLPKYGVDESDTQRGNLAINNLIKELRDGYKCVFLISHKLDENALFLQALGEKLAESNINENNLRLYRQEIKGYGDARRFGMREAVAEFPEVEVVFQGEAEKDLTPFIGEFIKPIFEEGVGIVTMQRESLKSLPFYQQMGEAIQDGLIHSMQSEAGFAVGKKPEDILNGTRFIANKPLETRYERKVSPLDLFTKVDFAYSEAAADEVKEIYKFGIDKYCSAVYFPLVVARELGIKVRGVEVPYKHNPEQTKLEDKDESFREKRIDQAKDIVAQHFDLVASMMEYKTNGRWPSVLWEALDEGKPLELKHFDMAEWRIVNGKLIKR
jgi:hypothetical protein